MCPASCVENMDMLIIYITCQWLSVSALSHVNISQGEKKPRSYEKFYSITNCKSMYPSHCTME